MHEQVNEKTVALTINGTKLTSRLLARAMNATGILIGFTTPKLPHNQ